MSVKRGHGRKRPLTITKVSPQRAKHNKLRPERGVEGNWIVGAGGTLSRVVPYSGWEGKAQGPGGTTEGLTYLHYVNY